MKGTHMKQQHSTTHLEHDRPDSGHRSAALRGAVALTLASVFLLTGCAGSPAAPSTALAAAQASAGEVVNVTGSETFTNPTVDAPTTAEQAVADATATLTQYQLLYDYIFTHEGAGSDQVSTFVTTDASSGLDASASSLSDGSMTATGTPIFTQLKAQAGDNVVADEHRAFQAVAVTGCYDLTAMKVSKDSVALASPGKQKVDIVLAFETDANIWRVSSIQSYPTAEECS